jgi:hypothetical protein
LTSRLPRGFLASCTSTVDCITPTQAISSFVLGADNDDRCGNMASFLRGKQAGMSNDLSASILPELFAPDDLVRYGINSQIRSVCIGPPAHRK